MKIYVDGACKTSTKVGGWAVVITKDDEKVKSIFNSESDTTNNRMEIRAAIEALRYLKENKINEASIYSDSMYVIGTITRSWKRNKNHDLWEELDELMIPEIEWFHVKGHDGHKWNELADTLAVEASNHIILRK